MNDAVLYSVVLHCVNLLLSSVAVLSIVVMQCSPKIASLCS